MGGLLPGQAYWLALKVLDEVPLASDLSNVVWQTTDLTDSTPASDLWQVQTVDAPGDTFFYTTSLDFDPFSGNRESPTSRVTLRCSLV